MNPKGSDPNRYYNETPEEWKHLPMSEETTEVDRRVEEALEAMTRSKEIRATAEHLDERIRPRTFLGLTKRARLTNYIVEMATRVIDGELTIEEAVEALIKFEEGL